MAEIIENPTDAQIDEIITQMHDGKIIVYPTDTIYGIGANIFNAQAIRKTFYVKQRSVNKPLSIIVHNRRQIDEIAYTNPKINKILKKLLPGSYTILLNKKPIINDMITAHMTTVGIRIPDNQITYKLTRDFPITTTSANITHKPTPDNIIDIQRQLKDKITTYIDTGVMADNTPSTIIDLTQQYPKIIREAKTDNNIEKILEIKLY
ncbi:L-threonylcarbamoyladenylate synthase [Methanosphaera cuniculi]|uniref:L-threonylcarbamoyladenylate synthase n=1 Tax=Methanosphaera cuniculi TaxID=1077256 RepID=A0A2A2HDJ3_9EURY|nr:L-threonylcarbamoyladenylate synthase [Methanosphaera cuniculi]PAV07366.1 translation factor sua5 [Methanosphaera cuniculi]PWL07944.1 threonylcarbamoyl-AMP synthase [Methanosphaera cuniculi]